MCEPVGRVREQVDPLHPDRREGVQEFSATDLLEVELQVSELPPTASPRNVGDRDAATVQVRGTAAAKSGRSHAPSGAQGDVKPSQQSVPPSAKAIDRAVEKKGLRRQLREHSAEDINHERVVDPNVLMPRKAPGLWRLNVEEHVPKVMSKPRPREPKMALASRQELAGVQKPRKAQQQASRHPGPPPKAAKRDHGPQQSWGDDRPTAARQGRGPRPDQRPRWPEVGPPVLPPVCGAKDCLSGHVLGQTLGKTVPDKAPKGQDQKGARGSQNSELNAEGRPDVLLKEFKGRKPSLRDSGREGAGR